MREDEIISSGKGCLEEPEEKAYLDAVKGLDAKIVVLDDDPTGIQTVHGIYVYTDWDLETIRKGFDGDEKVFYVLTNSRSMGEEESVRIHREIAYHVAAVSKETGKDFLLVSRGDSTLRGHYPAETAALKEELEQQGFRTDGEILCPFFLEGGRFTIGDIHYVRGADGTLTPAGETEFAGDATFGYRSSDIKDWVEEKTHGAVKREEIQSITVEELREGRIDEIIRKLMDVNAFGKIIVNAACYGDLKVFATAFARAVSQGKRFMLRTAASAVRVLGGIPEKPLLTREELGVEDRGTGGLIVVGSHVNKTTRQLKALETYPGISFLEFHVGMAADKTAFLKEQKRVRKLCAELLEEGKTVAVYTSRERIEAGKADREENLRLSVQISDAVTQIVSTLPVIPKYLVAKGGITSSDIGTKALKVKRAYVPGQILPGIPVWMPGSESRFPGIPYVVFPGNVGADTDLLRVVSILEGRQGGVV